MKRKHIIALIIVSVSYLIIVLTIKYRYEYKKEHEICEGFTMPLRSTTMLKMAMKSDTDIFKVDDVSFDIYYGMYKEGDDSPESYYIKESGETPFFVMYISEFEYDYSDHKNHIVNDVVYSDYKNIGINRFIKEISEEEVFSGKYAYAVKKSRIEYKHSETITIQKELFNKAEGEIAIKICAFVPIEDGYRCSEMEQCILIKYKYIDEDTIRIKYVHH